MILEFEVSEVVLGELIAKYELIAENEKYAAYSRDQARETIRALEELRERRKSGTIPVLGYVS